MRTRTALILALALLAWIGIVPGAPAQAPQRPKPSAGRAPENGSAERADDKKAILALGEAFTKAFNSGDAQAVTALFTDEAEVTYEHDLSIHGRKAIAAQFAQVFADNPGDKIELTAESIRFLSPDVAREVGRARTTPARGGSADSTRYVVLFVRREGRWLHDSVHELPDPSPTAHDRLKELEWMIGEWVDESDDGVVHTTCRWSDDGSFLIREFTLRVRGERVHSGTQRVGWDPLATQFRSWVFDPDGGFSQGVWSRGENGQWIIKASGVMADGRAVTATQILTFVSKGVARWHSVARTVGGEAIADMPEVTLVRTPPKAVAPPAPSPSGRPRTP